MKLTSSAGTSAKSASETVLPRQSGSEKSGASTPNAIIVLAVWTI